MPARLADLSPIFQQAPGCPVTLRFICPACGPPYKIDIPVNLNGETPSPTGAPTWSCVSPGPPNFSWDNVTVTPSINNTVSGHGRKRPCTWHGSITNGELRP